MPHSVNHLKKSIRVFGYKYMNTRHSCQDSFFVILIKADLKIFLTKLERKQFSYKNF